MKKITIVDIARLAGVGTTTVSRYFNNGKLKEETKKKIKKVVEKYNYSPNTFAKALKSNESRIIGVIVPTLSSFVSSRTLMYVDQKLKENNYETLIMNSNFSSKLQLEYLKKLARMNVDGIILLPTIMDKNFEATIKSIDIPVVILGQEGEYTYSVEYNDFHAGRDIANFVMASGHRDIVYLGVDEKDIAVGTYRKMGIVQTLGKYGIIPKEIITTFDQNYSYEKVIENIKFFKDSTCLICATDNIAYGAIRALEKNNLIVGENYSVAAFGNYESSVLLKSPLTTIEFNIKEAAEKTVDIILQTIKGEEATIKTLIGYELKIRDSVLDIGFKDIED
ncbi:MULTISPECIES: LacI family DNA-binding transcriptional regulator [unclassified Gemella]|uniref:LacI family DNA-binding transcriptional regulator n=1 Tax=unclassified Gemella TaxID=2624949 RepID=UPI00107482ED|nr:MULTISPECIES: LacI family DNA-binding transcriptional regulator [unclassified Gemella]MBF0710045.1 LacI family DNA-binding transcriptional regulator [Gemella sp. GL1.1]MBF0746124.1 LacI family DNA-binding transcriptional regulator [Gemella sp. 19428wG2_WT2a]NYS27389.1 LacI family DNA-binding transcriptional regulator [Gemella sp. GL1]TFU60413.1 trehalose repressor [Gemella sp. WT2a]